MSRVLVLEPEASVRRVIAETLEDEGIEVTAYKQFRDLSRALRAVTADLVILDIMMPKHGGADILEALKSRAPHTAVIQLTKPFSAEQLKKNVRNVLQQRETIQKRRQIPASVGAHILPEIHDPASGRLDAKRVADYVDIPLSTLAVAIGKRVKTVHKNPAGASLQEPLAPIARTSAILSDLFGSRERVRAWLNSPHPDLGNRTPLSVIVEGKGAVVTEMLEAALAGQPS